jgi:hypothetical protein
VLEQHSQQQRSMTHRGHNKRRQCHEQHCTGADGNPISHSWLLTPQSGQMYSSCSKHATPPLPCLQAHTTAQCSCHTSNIMESR